MADATSAPRGSAGTTGNVAAATVGSVTVAKWALGCLVAHHLVMPDDNTLLILCGGLMPLVHSLYLALPSRGAKAGGPTEPVPFPNLP
jgi:hypothetical protein